MTTERIDQIVRNFAANGMKVLLGNRANVRDLLVLTGSNLVDGMDSAHMKQVPTSYVSEDFRNLESDVVWTVPFRGNKGMKRITVYVLIEHQSEPDPLMIFRVMQYMVLIWRDQILDYKRRHRSLRGMRLQPILPLVFYTGTRTWERLEPLSALMDQGHVFAGMTPNFEPLFINLSAMAPEALSQEGAYFGSVLHLVQSRRVDLPEFRALILRVVDQLGPLSAKDRTRWLELLSFIHALVYHAREESERSTLHDTVNNAIRDEGLRREVSEMPRTIAEALKAEGRREGRREGSIESLQDTLLRQLRQRFTKVPTSVEKAIRATRGVEQLNTWLDLVLTAPTLKDMGIAAKP